MFMLLEIPSIPIRSSVKYIELISAIVGTIYFYKYKHTFLKYFLVILWYTAVNEFTCYFLRKYGIVANNLIIYNIFHLINFSFLFLLFNRFLKVEKHKRLTSVFLLIYVSSFFMNMIFENYLERVQTIPFFIAAILLIVSIVFYFSKLLKSNEVLSVKTNLLFWISVGYLLYLSGNLPIRVIRNYYLEEVRLEYILEFSSILSIILNICFIIGFICGKKDKQQQY